MGNRARIRPFNFSRNRWYCRTEDQNKLA